MAPSILDLIAHKRDGCELTGEQIHQIIADVCRGVIPDYQLGALLMAIYLRGMTDRETADLTMAMVHSGEVLDLGSIPGFKADKHSTGGVGDKVTPILGPLLASAGVSFPKLSGRGLGHTGGTLDKLESIPGFRVDLSNEEFVHQVQELGLAISGQTTNLVPADGILYGLRDVTATVDSIPLIASSVMSKKIAAGADGIVLDVKCGHGAFMQTRDRAVALAQSMVSIGQAAGKRTTAVVTTMNEPLGRAVGNALEIKEAIAVLQGSAGTGEDGCRPLRDICILLGAHTLLMAGRAHSIDEAQSMLEECMATGAALEKLRAMIQAQGGDSRVIDDPELLAPAQEVVVVQSTSPGIVAEIDARRIGMLVMDLGAGRKRKGDPVDHAVGVILHVQVGDQVVPGQTLAEIHTNHRLENHIAVTELLQGIHMGTDSPTRVPHVLEVVTDV